MATQTFPKSYLLERIDARLASLERLDQPDVVLVTEWALKRDEKARQWVATLPAALREVKEAAVEWKHTLEEDPNVIREAAAELETLLSRLPRNAYPHPEWRTDASRQKEQADTASERLKRRATERDALTHTRAYLQDTPIEEFSTTMLGRLGLIDAVKFSLDEARAEAQAAAKAKRR